MLDGLGWNDTDGDGIRKDSGGNKIEFTLATNAGNTVRQRIGEIIQKGMTDAGLDVKYEQVEFGELVSMLTDTYERETILVGFTCSTEPHGGITFWHNSEALHIWNPYQEEPATEWEAEINELYVRGSQELDRAKRMDYYLEAQEIAAENVPVVYTTLPERLSPIRNVFGNMTPTLYGFWDIRYLYRTDQ